MAIVGRDGVVDVSPLKLAPTACCLRLGFFLIVMQSIFYQQGRATALLIFRGLAHFVKLLASFRICFFPSKTVLLPPPSPLPVFYTLPFVHNTTVVYLWRHVRASARRSQRSVGFCLMGVWSFPLALFPLRSRVLSELHWCFGRCAPLGTTRNSLVRRAGLF